MRLTLRTLLAYLDDTLEPSETKMIGQKVAEQLGFRLVDHRLELYAVPLETKPGPSAGK